MTKTRKCDGCGDKIPTERLRLLPDTRECVRCSSEAKRQDVETDGADPADVSRSSSFNGNSR